MVGTRRFRGAALAFAAAVELGCSSEATPLVSLYEAQVSALMTSIRVNEAVDAADCGPPSLPVATTASFLARRATDHFTVEDEVGGCLLRASWSLGEWIADGASCELRPDGELAGFGVRERTFRRFRLSDPGGALLIDSRSLQQTRTGPIRLCHVGEGRLSGLEPRPRRGDAIWIYEGGYSRTIEQGDALAPCGEPADQGTASGFLFADVAVDAASLYFEGLGCRVSARPDELGVVVAESAACAFEGRVSARNLGITEIVFEKLAFDANGFLAATVKLTRALSSGARTSCFRLAAGARPWQ